MEKISQAVIDSLVDQIAVIDSKGYIIAINQSWVKFSISNGGELLKTGIGNNYLSVCQQEVKSGIIDVINGRKDLFSFEYPCHSDQELKWFLLRATPFVIEINEKPGAVISHVNITDRKLAEIHLKRNEERYRLIADNSSDFISIQSLEGVFTYVSPICYSILGYKQREMLGKSFYNFIHEDDFDELKSMFDTNSKNAEIVTIMYRIRRKDGKYIWFETKSQYVLSIDDTREEMVSISRDVTKYKHRMKMLENEKKSLQKTIFIDELTGLYNRRFFNEKLSDETKKLQQTKDFSLLVIDIDYFKKYNDTYGHLQGDKCLIQVAQTLKMHVRENGYACRIGGEEFCILLPNTNKKRAISFARRIRTAVEDLRILHDSSEVSRFVTVSIGVANLSGDGSMVIDHDKLFLLADQALYKAKASGRNQVNYY